MVCATPFDDDDLDPIPKQPSTHSPAWRPACGPATAAPHKARQPHLLRTVWINCHNVLDASLLFGGYKQSGWGRERGRKYFTTTRRSRRSPRRCGKGPDGGVPVGVGQARRPPRPGAPRHHRRAMSDEPSDFELRPGEVISPAAAHRCRCVASSAPSARRGTTWRIPPARQPDALVCSIVIDER